MSYSFYDWNQAVQQRNEYVEDRLKDGSPVVAVSYDDGILLLTLRGTQRKLFDVYDRLMMGALGKQSDIESLRLAAIDVAHKEGFERSPDDVSIQRLVGFSLSPAVKRVYNDQQAIPLTLRAIFVEMGRSPDSDHFFLLGYDGEFAGRERCAVAGGTPYAEEQAEESLREARPATLQDALRAALTAWGIGRSQLAPKSESDEEDEEFDPLRGSDDRRNSADESDAPKVSDDPVVAVREALKDKNIVEAAILNRNAARESKFRLLQERDLEPVLADYR
jgi:proteasome alpha subunit